MLHTLAYKGMNVFPGSGANLPTQLWIAARSLQAVTLFIAPLFMERKMHHRAIFGIYAAVTSLLVAMIYSGAFPDCYIEGKGLTTFKIGFEYLMVALLLTSLYLFRRIRKHFDGTVYRLTLSSIACTALSGIMFTSYVNVYDVANMAGHFFKLAAFYLIYRAILVTGFQKPFAVIFRDLKQTEEELRQAYETLEEKVRERTAALRESKRKFRSLAENSPDNIARYDQQCRAIYCNPRLMQTVVVEPEMLLGKTPVEFGGGGPEVAAEYEGHIRRVLEKGDSSDMELLMPHPEGGLRTHLVRFAAERDTDGTITGVLAIGRDITERKATEHQIHILNHALDHVHEGAFLIDPQGKFVYVNREACRSLGYSRDELLGMAIPDIDPDYLAERVAEHVAELLEVRFLTFETRHRTRDGRIFPVEITATVFEYDGASYLLSLVRNIAERKRMEEVLRESEERFRLLVELSPDLIFIRHDEWIVYANPAAARMVGANSAEELIGKSVLDFALPERRESLKKLIADNNARQIGEVTASYDGTLVRLDGSLVPIELTAVRFQYRGMSCSQLMMRDITERKLAEEKLQESEQRLRLALEAAQIGIWDWNVSNDSWHASPTYYTMLGYEPRTGPGDRAEWMDRLHPDDRVLFTRKMHDVLSRNFSEYEYEARLLHADGTYRWQLVKGIGIEHDQDGKVTRMLGVRIDITERKQAEELLYKREQEFRALADNSPDYIGRYDRECRRIYINRTMAKLFNCPMENIIGTKPTDMSPLTSAFRYEQAIRETWEHCREFIGEGNFLTAEGELSWVHIRMVPELDLDGQVTSVLAISHDITERKQAEENLHRLNEELEERVQHRTADLEQANVRLQQLDLMKSMFIASMSHELRTPLNSVIGFSRILHNEWAGPLNEGQKDNIETILRSGKHLLSLVNDVIDVSRIEAGMIDVMPEEFDVHDLVSEVVTAFENSIRDKGIDLKVQAVHHSLHTDRTRLLQCLLNLVSNAEKYTEKGAITICAKLAGDGGMLELSVVDTGIGMSEDDLGKLFSPFVRLDSPLTSTVPGTGLGLYLTRKLVKEVLQGDITVTSAPGVGSTFVLTVPVKL